MSITVSYNSQLTVVETLEGPYVSSSDSTVTTNGLNTTVERTASTTQPVTKYSAFLKALSGGTGTIDLTSLPDAGGNAGAVTFSGLKLQFVKFINPSTNANAITIAKGASNGHTGLGSSFSITLQPGGEYLWKGNDNTTDVGGSDKTFDLSGTGSQSLQVELVAG